MRTKNTINNISYSVLNSVIAGILKFVFRTIFIRILGETVLGVNGLFTNVLSILALTELGIGAAISFSLYKPLADNENKKVAALMNFYKKAYRYISIIVSVIGLAILPLLKYIINDYEVIKQQIPYLDYIYILFLLNTIVTYLMAYKRTLIIANQKEYKITKYVVWFNVISILAQSLSLIITKNYIICLITQLILKVLENIVINRYIDKGYSYLKEYSEEKLEKEETKTIYSTVKAMLYHKIGDICINSTDNILIAKYVSLSAVGIYANYFMIIGITKIFIMSIFNNMISSMGNLIAKENEEKRLEIFNIMNFIAFWLFSFTSVLFLVTINPFINIWLGEKYLFSNIIVIVILFDYYLSGMRLPITTVKISAGMYVQDKYVPIISSIINLVVSVILVKYYGIIGIFIGTVISSLVLPLWYGPMVLFKWLFKKPSFQYFYKYTLYLLVTLVSGFAIYFVTNIQLSDNKYLQLIYSFIICVVLQNLIIVLIFRRTKEFKEILRIGKGMLNRRKV